MKLITKTWCHFCTVNEHRWRVFRLCCKAGIPWRGLVHDLSKYSPTEFCESVRFYTGMYSPIEDCKAEKGYSAAWQHHKGRNKHHYEYWTDNYDKGTTYIKMPKIYAIELVCDRIAASQTYLKSAFTNDAPLKYYEHQESCIAMHAETKKFVRRAFEQYAELGDASLNELKIAK